MAKIAYIGVDGIARKVKQQYIGVDGIARKVKSGYIGVDGIARQYFVNAFPISELEVGSSVYLNVNGIPTEFLIVQRDRPGFPDTTAYHVSCFGTWLLMKDIYIEKRWSASKTAVDYSQSEISKYLNTEFLGLFDEDIQGIIKTVKIPYSVPVSNGDGTFTRKYYEGTNGLSTKIFLLSDCEVGGNKGEGKTLDYFYCAAKDRIAYLNGIADSWWLRTPSDTKTIQVVSSEGALNVVKEPDYGGYGVRPALIISNDTLVDSNFNVIA